MSTEAHPAPLSGGWKIPTSALLAIYMLKTAGRRQRAKRVDGERQWRVMAKYLVRALIFFLLPRSRLRAGCLCYLWLRFVDDVMDRDAPVPEPYSYAAYLQRKEKVAREFVKLDEEDELVVRMREDCRHLRIDLSSELWATWVTMCDESFRPEWHVQTEAKLQEQSTLMDTAHLSALIKALGGNVRDPAKDLRFMSGLFTPIEVLADLVGDLEIGKVNLTFEAAIRLGMDSRFFAKRPTWSDLCAVPGFLAWYAEEIRSLEALWSHAEPILWKELRARLPSIAHAYLGWWIISTKWKGYVRRAKARLAP